MAATRTPSITIPDDGRFLIDKRHCGIRIIRRLGAITQERAAQRLKIEMQHATSRASSRRGPASPTARRATRRSAIGDEVENDSHPCAVSAQVSWGSEAASGP